MATTAREMNPLDLFISALKSHDCRPRLRGDEWYAKCPVHGGNDFDSLGFKLSVEGNVLVTCHSQGCSYTSVMEAVGLSARDGFGDNVAEFRGKIIPLRSPNISSGGEPDEIYDYVDENGVLLYQVCRYEADGKKTFRQRLASGEWKLGDVRRVLYRLPAVLRAIKDDQVVYVVEGEKDVHTLESLGLVATCCMGGACAKSSKWMAEWTDCLAGGNIVVLPDNDGPGKIHAEVVRGAVAASVLSVRVVDLPGLAEKGDVTDWVEAGGTAELLKDLSSDVRLNVMRLDELLEFGFPEKEQLMEPWLFSQDLTLLHAGRGVGKTYFLIGLTLALATGGEFLGWKAPKPVEVLYVDGEMPGTTLQSRFLGMLRGLDKQPTDVIMPRIITPDIQKTRIRGLSTIEGRADLLEVITPETKFIILDNLACLYGGDENDAASWDAMQGFLLSLRTRGISVLLVHHSGKSGKQRGTSHREDVLDSVLNLVRPADYTSADGAKFEIHFEKARNLHGDQIPEIEAMLENDGDRQFFSHRTIEDARIRQIVEMVGLGMTQRNIAIELGVAQSTVSRLIKELKRDGSI